MFGNTDATPRLDVMYLEQESNRISSLSHQIILIGHLTCHCSDGLVDRLCNILYRTLAMLHSNPNMVLNGVPNECPGTTSHSIHCEHASVAGVTTVCID